MSRRTHQQPIANHTSIAVAALVPSSQTVQHGAIPLAILKGVSFSFNFISILASLLLILMFYYFRSKKPLLLNRVSLRLVLAIAYANILYSITQILTDVSSTSSMLCTITPYLYIVFTLLTVFLTASIAFNLHAVFVLGKENTVQYERWYYMLSIVLAAACPAPALFSGMFGWSPVEDSCWFQNEGVASHYVLWVFGSYYMWLILALTYCTFVVVRVTLKLLQKRKTAERNVEMGKSEMDQVMRKQMRVAMLKMVSRNVRYPAVPIITQSFNVIHDMVLWGTGTSVYVLMFASYVGTALQGLLTFIVFVLDPAVQRAYESIRKDAVLDYLHEEDMWNERRAMGDTITATDYGGVGTRLQRWAMKTLFIDDAERANWLREKMLQSVDESTGLWTADDVHLKTYGSSGSSSFGSSDDEDMEGNHGFHTAGHDDDAPQLAMPAPAAPVAIFAHHSDTSSLLSVDFVEANDEIDIAAPQPAFLRPNAELERALTPDIPGRSVDALSMDSLDRVAAVGAQLTRNSLPPAGNRARNSIASLGQFNSSDTLERLKYEQQQCEESDHWGAMCTL